MWKDDIEVLPASIPANYDSKLVLAEQNRLVLKHLPLALCGSLFTSLCFFATMFLTYDLNPNQKVLNTLWLTYNTLVLGLLWTSLHYILKSTKKLDLQLLKKIFGTFVTLFIVAIVLSVPVFISLLHRDPLIEVIAAKALIIIWIFFHSIIIYASWFNWQKIKAVAHSFDEKEQAVTHPTLYEPSTVSDYSHAIDYVANTEYLANYSAYSVLFISALTSACLWAMAIGKVLMTGTHSPTQVIVLISLHLGLLSGGISSLAMFWRIYIAFIMPSLIMWTFLLFFISDIGLSILAFAVIGLLLFDIFFAKHTSTMTLKSIVTYLDNANLVKQLQVKSREVEDSSKAKTQFLAAASHDLRQPIHALSLFIEALGDTELNSHQIQIVDYAKSASYSSREMLNTLLDYAHLESGQITPHFIPTEVDSIIQHLVDEFSLQASRKGLDLRYKPTKLWVMTDPTMLALILRNFISNAIRYTQKGGILIGVRKLPTTNSAILIEYCSLSVWDTGTGIAPNEIKPIFDSFYQIEGSKTTELGLGLGLAIVKGMTQLLKAELHVKSKLGVGSQFSVILPVCSPDPDSYIAKNNKVDYLKGRKVLVVDDDDFVVKAMEFLLHAWGCEPIAAHTLSDAVTYFEANNPDIVITDFRLENGVTGGDVIAAIKKSHQFIASTAFIILTADTSPQLFTTTKSINPIVLHKPIDPKNLRHHLQQLAKP